MRSIKSNKSKPLAFLMHVRVSQGKARVPCSHMLGGTAADMAAALLIHHQSSEQTTQVLGRAGRKKKNKKNNSPGQSRGPEDPLTKRVSLPAHRELLEE